MRYDTTRAGMVPYQPRPPSPALRRVWLGIFWPGLRMMLKTIALPLALFVGLPACLFTLASMDRAMHLFAMGQPLRGVEMVGAAWLCGSLAALACWPRRL